MACLSSLKNRAKLLLSSLPVSPSRVLRAPGTSPYHLVPKHFRATWPRPKQSQIFPEACSPNGTDNRQQRQRRTKNLKKQVFERSRISKFWRAAQRYGDFKLAKPHVMANLNMACLSSLKNRAKLLLFSLPVSPSRVLRAPGTSPYHLVPKHLRPRGPGLPEACYPNVTDNRQQRQRRTKRPPLEPSDINSSKNGLKYIMIWV